MPTLLAVAWEPQPDVWLAVGGLAAAYWWALRAWGPRHAPGGIPATTRHKACFALGVLALWVGGDWPIHDIAEDHLYSVHMVQHMLFQLVAPPLLLLGTPAWLWRRLLPTWWLRAAWRVVTRPVYALLLVGGFTALMHVPVVVNVTARLGWVHFLAHVAVVGVGLIMWWPVLSPLPEIPHASYLGRMAYLFGHSVLPTVPASFLTFTDTAFYRWYAEAPRLVEALDPVTDLQIAGLVMKIGGGLLLWAVIAVLFFKWAEEHRTGGPDPLYWSDLEPEVAPSEAGAGPADPPPTETDR